MEDSGASFGVAKAMFWPRMLSTMTVIGDWEVAESMMETVGGLCATICLCAGRIGVY